MRTTSRIGLIVGIALTLLSVTLLWSKRNSMVLVHAFADTGCACGDFHEEVSGINLLNPLRDRVPEKTADAFFLKSASGQCSARYEADLCRYYENEAPVKSWRLVNAAPNNDGVDLFYKLDSSKKTRISDRPWTGEGCVHVRRIAGGWQVAWYSAYF